MAPKKDFDEGVVFAATDLIEETRFSFVYDKALRANIAISTQYIAFLWSLETVYTSPGAVRHRNFLTIIIHAGSIVEALLSYVLQELIRRKHFNQSDLFEYREEFKKKGEICNDQNGEKVIFGVNKKIQIGWEERKFQNLIKAAKKTKYFSDDCIQSCTKLKNMRNKIHLSGANPGDMAFSEHDISNLFEDMSNFITEARMIFLKTAQ